MKKKRRRGANRIKAFDTESQSVFDSFILRRKEKRSIQIKRKEKVFGIENRKQRMVDCQWV